MAHLLGAEALHLQYPTRTVFDSVSLGVNEGDRIGIVGRNGDGKSTLLAMLAGRLEPQSGRVTRRRDVRLGVLEQNDVFEPGETVAHAVVGQRPDHEWASDPRVREVIAGLLSDLSWEADVDSLSGGQRRRVSLARLLVGEHDVLAMDEPTNHLDMEAISWLAEHLKRRWSANSGALLVVTHDRWFLDEVCTATWEVHDRIVEPFEGGYAAYILQRVERDRQAAAIEAKRQNLARKELAWLRRGAPARTSKPKFRIDAANQLISDVPEIRNDVELKSLAVSRLGKDVVDILDASVSFGEKSVLKDVTWRLAPGERTGIMGPNGAGKSTLLGLIDSSVSPSGGRVKRGKTVQVATLSQRLDELEEHLDDPVRVVLARLRTSYTIGTGSKAKELTPSQLLERLGFSSAQLSTPIKDLSGGQKRRVQLLLILLTEPNVLILDEPTNDLDTDMLSAIEDLLDSWPGTLIVVSHDRYFMERVTDQQYAVLDGSLRHLPGGVDEYLALRKNGSTRLPGGSAAGSSNVSAQGGSFEGTEDTSSLSGAERRAAAKELGAVERKMERLQATVTEIQSRMATHDPDDYAGLGALSTEAQEHEKELAGLEERWLELSEALG